MPIIIVDNHDDHPRWPKEGNRLVIICTNQSTFLVLGKRQTVRNCSVSNLQLKKDDDEWWKHVELCACVINSVIGSQHYSSYEIFRQSCTKSNVIILCANYNVIPLSAMILQYLFLRFSQRSNISSPQGPNTKPFIWLMSIMMLKWNGDFDCTPSLQITC